MKQAKAKRRRQETVAALALDELADAHAAISALRDELTQSEEAMTVNAKNASPTSAPG